MSAPKMKRYHTQVFTPEWAQKSLYDFCKELNYAGEWKFSDHSQDKLYDEFQPVQERIKNYLDSVWFDRFNIFEFYVKGREIEKAGFRIRFTKDKDLILIVARGKLLVTLYLNNSGDQHRSLNGNRYETE